MDERTWNGSRSRPAWSPTSPSASRPRIEQVVRSRASSSATARGGSGAPSCSTAPSWRPTTCSRRGPVVRRPCRMLAVQVVAGLAVFALAPEFGFTSVLLVITAASAAYVLAPAGGAGRRRLPDRGRRRRARHRRHGPRQHPAPRPSSTAASRRSPRWWSSDRPREAEAPGAAGRGQRRTRRPRRRCWKPTPGTRNGCASPATCTTSSATS